MISLTAEWRALLTVNSARFMLVAADRPPPTALK